jgi:hypothetical protein
MRTLPSLMSLIVRTTTDELSVLVAGDLMLALVLD